MVKEEHYKKLLGSPPRIAPLDGEVLFLDKLLKLVFSSGVPVLVEFALAPRGV